MNGLEIVAKTGRLQGKLDDLVDQFVPGYRVVLVLVEDLEKLIDHLFDIHAPSLTQPVF